MSFVASTFNVSQAPFTKTIDVPSSKSYANRLLILAAIKDTPVGVRNLPLSSDVETMIECLKKVGLDISETNNGLIIKNSFPACEKEGTDPITLHTKDGGTTNRFLAPFLARGKRKYILEAEGHMRERPMEGLCEAIESLEAQAKLKSDEGWLVIKGPMKGERVEVDSSQTTQFLTGMALALSDQVTEVVPSNLGVSLPYWELTKSLIKLGKSDENIYQNPVDFSSLSYPLALAVVTGEVTVKNCFQIDPNQADSMFIKVLEEMGATIQFSQEGLICRKGQLKAIEFDGSQCPDVIPTLLYVCSFAQGTSRIHNLEVLTHKECDRFQEMIKILENFEIEHTFNSSTYEIKIVGNPKHSIKKDYLPPADHRMVMVTYLFQRTLGGGRILDNAQHVAKSFSNFFEVMK